MPSTALPRTGTGVEELLLRFGMAAHRIQDADYIGAMKSLRYWDRGYDLGTVPRAMLEELHTHSLAARVCLASGDARGASEHVRTALSLAAGAGPGTAAPATPKRTGRRRRQSAKSGS